MALRRSFLALTLARAMASVRHLANYAGATTTWPTRQRQPHDIERGHHLFPHYHGMSPAFVRPSRPSASANSQASLLSISRLSATACGTASSAESSATSPSPSPSSADPYGGHRMGTPTNSRFGKADSRRRWLARLNGKGDACFVGIGLNFASRPIRDRRYTAVEVTKGCFTRVRAASAPATGGEVRFARRGAATITMAQPRKKLPERSVDVFCKKCRTQLYKYKKGGKGSLVKCYKERIVEDFTGGKLECPKCGQLFARDTMVHGRPAFKMISGKVYQKK